MSAGPIMDYLSPVSSVTARTVPSKSSPNFFPKLLNPYARQTTRLQALLLELAHLSSAEGAARMAKVLGYLTCGDSLIRLQRRETTAIQEPRVIGIDEFAFRRGATYGTLIVDEERHQVIDALDSDQAEPCITWLQAHPGIEIITRDRDESYAAAGTAQRLPGAIQVADRFHLVRNVGDALKKLFQSRSWKMPAKEVNPTPPTETPDIEPATSISIPQPTPRKLTLWQEVQKKKAEGYSMKAIGIALGMGRHTVKRYLDMENPPVYSLRRDLARHPNKVSPFLTYLQQRWEAGCQDGRQLYQEIVKLGYQGKLTQVYEALRPWREGKRLHLPPPQSPPPLFRWLLRPPG